MKTIDLEVAMMSSLNMKQNIVVPNVSWGIWDAGRPLHECDILVLTRNRYAMEIEIKISKADLLQDKNKLHGHNHNLIARFYFAVPEDLGDYALKNIPERSGLYVVYHQNDCKLVRKCQRNKYALQWTEKQQLKLAHLGCMRILTLKKKLIKEKENGFNSRQ